MKSDGPTLEVYFSCTAATMFTMTATVKAMDSQRWVFRNPGANVGGIPFSPVVNGNRRIGDAAFSKEMEVTRQAVRVAPDYLTNYINLTNFALALQRFDEARQSIHEVQARKGDDYILRNAMYALAFLRSDPRK
ncbi:MAG: hypothetical protein WB795_19700 [Candidatus Acidiferrales bacterium]